MRTIQINGDFIEIADNETTASEYANKHGVHVNTATAMLKKLVKEGAATVRDEAYCPWHPAGYQLCTRFVKVYAINSIRERLCTPMTVGQASVSAALVF